MSDTAARIRQAAHDEFAVAGYTGASMARIRERAEVSNGSLFHFFPRKADLAAAVLNDGMRQCRHGVLTALESAPGAAAGVHAAVHVHLRWVAEQPDLARFLFADVPDAVLLAAEPDFGAQNGDYVERVTAWLDERGLRRGRPFEVVHAVWLGPAMEWTRTWLRGRSRIHPSAVSEELAEAAWRAVGGP